MEARYDSAHTYLGQKMEQDIKDLIGQSVTAISSLEKHIKEMRIARRVQIGISIFFGIFGIVQFYFAGWWALITSMPMLLFYFGSKQKSLIIKESEELLDNAKFNESYLRAIANEDGEL